MFSFFFFKQKTAYEMRISDWSSDVCSSDLGETQEIPRRIDESVERVGLAQCLAAARRTACMLPCRMPVERIAGDREIGILGQHDRELALRHRHQPARRAMDEGDRRAPIALARDAPVAQAPHRRALDRKSTRLNSSH